MGEKLMSGKLTKVENIAEVVEMPKREKPKVVKRNEDGIRIQIYQKFVEGVHYEPVDGDEMTVMIEFIEKCNNLHRMGRPPKYETLDEFLGVIDAFWEVIKTANQEGTKLIPDVEGFCCFAGISRRTLLDWKDRRAGEYADTIDRLLTQIAFAKKQNALKGKIPPIVFATDFNNNHGYTQKQELVVSPNNPLGDIADEKELKQRYLNSVPDTDALKE